MTFKYLARVVAVGLLLATCGPAATASPTPAGSPDATPTAGPDGLSRIVAVRGDVRTKRWQTVPDGISADRADFVVEFDGDPGAGMPVARLRTAGREGRFAASPGKNLQRAEIDLRGLAPGTYPVDVIERVRGGEVVVAKTEFALSQPEYVVWTLDFEGDAASDDALANTAAIADGLNVPMTVMWNPRVWTTAQVSAERAEAMVAWTKAREARFDEVALHLHMWTDFVRAAGVAPRTAPSWAGRGDGYDVPLTAFSESETRTLLMHALKLMGEHGLPPPKTFRAGGQFANAANLRALAGLAFLADCSGVPAGAFGRLPLPWSLPKDAQPYRPAADDASKVGDLPLLEAPTIGGNTYGYDVRTIQPIIRADLSFLAPAGEIATARRAITIVSHPGTIDTTERAAIEALFDALAPLRYDSDNGPLRFVTLAQLAKAFGSG